MIERVPEAGCGEGRENNSQTGRALEVAQIDRVIEVVDQQFLEVKIESIPKLGDGSGAKWRIRVSKCLKTQQPQSADDRVSINRDLEHHKNEAARQALPAEPYRYGAGQIPIDGVFESRDVAFQQYGSNSYGDHGEHYDPHQ